MSQILLVEDDINLGQTLLERLIKEGFDVHWADSVSHAKENLASNKYHLILLDVGLPDGSGFDLAIEARKSGTPFIFMTAQNSAEDRLEGFELGAEEFIPKPFHLKELLLRMHHVLKEHPVKTFYELKESVVNFESHRIEYKNGMTEIVSLKDIQILKLLIDQSPNVVSRDEILNKVWGEASYPSNRTVDNVILRLRNILGEVDSKKIISIRGVGYQWLDEKN